MGVHAAFPLAGSIQGLVEARYAIAEIKSHKGEDKFYGSVETRAFRTGSEAVKAWDAAFAVYDGHGGPGAADYCQEHMVAYIEEEMKIYMDGQLPLSPGAAMQAGGNEWAPGLDEAIGRAFERVDKEVKAKMPDGTTALLVLLKDAGDKTLVKCAWVGDSRAILCFKVGGEIFELSSDHKADDEAEQRRIIEQGLDAQSTASSSLASTGVLSQGTAIKNMIRRFSIGSSASAWSTPALTPGESRNTSPTNIKEKRRSSIGDTAVEEIVGQAYRRASYVGDDKLPPPGAEHHVELSQHGAALYVPSAVPSPPKQDLVTEIVPVGLRTSIDSERQHPPSMECWAPPGQKGSAATESAAGPVSEGAQAAGGRGGGPVAENGQNGGIVPSLTIPPRERTDSLASNRTETPSNIMLQVRSAHTSAHGGSLYASQVIPEGDIALETYRSQADSVGGSTNGGVAHGAFAGLGAGGARAGGDITLQPHPVPGGGSVPGERGVHGGQVRLPPVWGGGGNQLTPRADELAAERADDLAPGRADELAVEPYRASVDGSKVKSLRENSEVDLSSPHGYVARYKSPTTGEAIGPHRVFNPETGVSLAVTRSIGDRDGALSVIAEPDIRNARIPLGANARVIIASDGVWDVADNRLGSKWAKHVQPEKAAMTLCKKAKKGRFYVGKGVDDITAILVDIYCPPQPEGCFPQCF